jgi:hypothetical protein
MIIWSQTEIFLSDSVGLTHSWAEDRQSVKALMVR